MPQRTRLYEVLRFVLVGGACFLLDYGLLYVLTAHLGVYYLVCVFRGAAAQTHRAKMLFFGSSIAGLGLNQLLMWSLVDLLHIHYMIAKLIAAGIVMLWNYVLKRRAVLGKT